MASRKQGLIAKSHGQRVPPLIKVITNTLRNYPDGSQILKELVQNADDASATEVEFLLDLTQHEAEFLIHPDVAKYQGPALYAWNNSVFDDEDWEGILDIGISRKENKVLKVGRFALGFISVYHITDFPCILSKDRVLLLDPHMVIDNTGGLLIGLEDFSTYESVKSQLSCFKNYFGYDGSGYYNGTIFRFPLRTGDYKTSLPMNVYDSNKVLEYLFEPFKLEIENCLLFMKSLYAIKVSVRESPESSRQLYSAEINPVQYRDSLRQHRQELFEFIEAEKFLRTYTCHISIFPVSLFESDLNKTVSLWLVINILGLTDKIPTKDFSISYNKLSDTYLPWVAIAMPLPHSQTTFHSITCQHCWSMEFEDIPALLELIDIHLPTIPLSREVSDFVGSLFCFLPITASSKFPFHVHGYFALSTNRRSIKWPQNDDKSVDSTWNKQLIASLGTISYAALIHISVSRLQCRGSNALVYKLLSCLPPGSSPNQLQAVMHRGALNLMQDRALVCTKPHCKWVPLKSAIFLPSPFIEYSIPSENTCSELLTALSRLVVELPSSVAKVMLEYSFLRDRVVPHILSPAMIRQLLIYFREQKCLTDFLSNRNNVYSLMDVVLSDIFNCPTASVLNGIQLIPTCDSNLLGTFNSGSKDKFYIYERGLEFIQLFPGLERKFIDSAIPPLTHALLLKLSRPFRINIVDITNIKTDPVLFFRFLKESMQTFFNTESTVMWKPGVSGHPEKRWIESLWKFLNDKDNLIEYIKQKRFPILPKQEVSSSQEIDLLPLIAPTHYIKPSNIPEYSKIEKLLAASGCHLCYKNPFISNFTQFVTRPLPKGFFPILQITNIRNKFLQEFCKHDNPTRQSLIRMVINIELTSQRELDLLKSFPIFYSLSSKWVSINQFRQLFIPHNSIPKDFAYFSDNYLSPFVDSNIHLCQKLGINALSLDATIQQHMLPLVTKGNLNSRPGELDKLTLWILRSFHHLNQDTLRCLSTAKWLRCSANGVTHVSLCTLYSPSELFDPRDRYLTKLLCTDIPGMFPDSIYKECYEVLTNLGMRTCENITYSGLCSVIKVALGHIPRTARQVWVNSLLNLISINFDRLDLPKRRFWDILKEHNFLIPSSHSECTAYPNSLPFFKLTNDLCNPQEIVLCSEKDACLIAGVTPLLIENPHRMNKYKAIYQCMGVTVTIQPQLVCKQLTLIISSLTNLRADLATDDMLSLVKKIYKYFGRLTVSNSDSLRNVMLPEKCIFIPDFGFTSSERLILSCHAKLFPYMVSLEKYYTISDQYLLAFFNYLKIESRLSSAKCRSILSQLQGTTLSQEQVQLSLSLIQYSHQFIVTDTASLEHYMLTQNKTIYPARECIFNDLAWLQRTEIAAPKPIVHPNISNQLASDFGCSPASISLAPSAQGTSYSFATGCGQSEDLVARLTGILKGYRMEIDVFKELIQNADDAGAHTIKILFDYTTHPSTSVLDEAIEDIHGPAIYFFNDAVFTERDFESILKLSSGNKLNSASKIGRFGVGFNAVYNFTDCPSLVSDCNVQIFDPLKKYIGPYKQSGGVRFRFTEDRCALNTYHDQFNVYNDLFDCNIFQHVAYKHTLFRLPLRRTPSFLSSRTFESGDILKLQSDIEKELTQMILFLQHITCIELYVRMESTSPIEKVVSVSKSDCETTHFISNNQKYFQLNPYAQRPPDSISSIGVLSITSDSKTERSVENFLISYASGVGQCCEVLRKFRSTDLLPLCGVAIPLQYLDNIPHDSACSLYTFLPLPITSPLPLHINGYFSLSDSRKNLSDARTNRVSDLPTEWNLALINDALSNALISAVAALPNLPPLSGSTPFKSHRNYYSLWTEANSTHLLWKDFSKNLASRIAQYSNSHRIFSCAQDPTKWIAFRDISFLLFQDSLTRNTRFMKCIYTLCLAMSIKFANVPNSFFSTALFKEFSKLAPSKRYGLERIIKEVISPNIPILKVEQIIIILKTLIPLCIEETNSWLLNWLKETEIVPCGVSPNDLQLRLPSMVVCLNTKISVLYQPNEQRHPVSELHDIFSLNNSDYTSIVLKRLGVIHDRLPASEIISRCQITEKLDDVELATKHALILIDYLSNEEQSVLKSVYSSIRAIRFIPVYRDEIVSILSDKHSTFAAPQECYSYASHILVSPVLTCASREVKDHGVLGLLSNPPPDAVIQVLDKLIAKADKFRGEITIQEKVLDIYKYLCHLQTSCLGAIKAELNNKTWIWHPILKEFYAVNQVIISPELLKFEDNKYLISFPYRDALADKSFETFLLNVGLKRRITDDSIIACFEKINKDVGTFPLKQSLIDFVLMLIDSISCFEKFSNLRCMMSQLNILHVPTELYLDIRSHLNNYFSEEHRTKMVSHQIHPAKAYKLGAKPCEEMFCSNLDSEFGLQEDIRDRILGLIREMPISSVVKEMIQNAEDAKASEIVFILDNQDYSSKTESLLDCMCPRLKELHSFPSLTVYNNKGFSENDLKGIQTLSVGGKSNNPNTIGKFGLGFNSVYHVTNAPTFITTCPGEPRLSYCCFDPFRKYTETLYENKNKRRGIRRDITSDNLGKFTDQLYPFRYEKFKGDSNFGESFINLWENQDYTMFRFPLDIGDVPESETDSNRRHCSIDELRKGLLEMLRECPDILLFLSHLRKLKVLSIDRGSKVTLHFSLSIEHRKAIQTEKPIWYPLRDSTYIQIQERKSHSQHGRKQWLIYSQPTIAIEEFVTMDTNLQIYEDYCSNEKLSGYGAIAIQTYPLNSKFSNLFTYLPVGLKSQFPVHVNAPLILDSSRQNLHSRKIPWEDAWHSSVIKDILVPLYAFLVLDLRQNKTQCKQTEYYNWFYSLFPRNFTDNNFLTELSKEFFAFLSSMNAEVLLADNLDMSDKRTWYSLYGKECGIFKPDLFFRIPKSDFRMHFERESQIRESLILIDIPLTFASPALLNSFKHLTQLTPMLLLSYLNDTPKRRLFKEQSTSWNTESLILNFQQMQTILQYILTEESSVLASYKIQLRIDLSNKLKYFDTQNPSYLSDYSSLLPHCAQDFNSLAYSNSVIHSLCTLGFVKSLDVGYLANNLKVDSSTNYSLFWEFVLVNKLNQEDISKFNQHLLVPVIFKKPHVSFDSKYYSIGELKFVMTSSLQENEKVLFDLLNTLGCPHLNFDSLTNPTKHYMSHDEFITELENFANTIAISAMRSSEIILGSIQCCTDRTAFLSLTECSKLLNICSHLKPSALSDVQLNTLSSLRIFESISSQFYSLEQCNICYIDEYGVPICPSLFTILNEKHLLIIFKNGIGNFLQALCQALKKQLIDISVLFSDYIFKDIQAIPFADQKEIMSFLAGKLSENKHDFISHLIDLLSGISFIEVPGKQYRRINQLYPSEIQFIAEFLPQSSLPRNWSVTFNLMPLFSKLGLNNSVSLDDILLVADKFSQQQLSSYICEKLSILLGQLKNTLDKINWDKLTQEEVETLTKLGNIPFLPIWKMNSITQTRDYNLPKLAKFSDAQLHKYFHCCCTSAWIHKFDFNFDTRSFNILRINGKPEPSLVVAHLRTIIRQLLVHHCYTNIPVSFAKYFHSCYSYFESMEPTCIPLEGFSQLRSILWKQQLYYPVNMLFTATEELKPFTIQVPPELASEYPHFLKCIGVEDGANYTQFSHFLTEIHKKLVENDQKLVGSNEKQTKIVFHLLIKNLRKLEREGSPPKFDLIPKLLLLTRDTQLMPNSTVVYADNQSLLSRVTKVGIVINILIPLEPDDNKSCVPPSCLNLGNLSDIIKEEIVPEVLTSMKIDATPFATFLNSRLKEPMVHRAIYRLYFHLTKQNLDHLLFNNGPTSLVSNRPPPPNYFTVIQLLKKFEVISVQRIDLNLIDTRGSSTKYLLTNVSSCFIRENTFLLSDDYSKHEFLVKDIAYSLNSYFGDIFTEVLHCLEVCIQIQDTSGIMEKLDEYNILSDDTCPMPTEIRSSVVSNRSRHCGFNSFPNHPCQPPRPEGISLGEPDTSAAHLSLIVTQCELRAAQHLITPIPPNNHIFPSLACFLCFEALINLFQSYLHFRGSVERLTQQRNLRVFLEFLSQLLLKSNPAIYREIEALTCPLMNYDIDTRYPPVSLIPMLSCYVPQQLFTEGQATEAILNVWRIFDLLTHVMYSEVPIPGELILSEGHPILTCGTALNNQVVKSILEFDVGDNIRQVMLGTESHEFKYVSRKFLQSMPYSHIMSITQIHNPKSWYSFISNISEEIKRYPNICQTIRLLFHGTSDVEPEKIIEDPSGFNMKYAHRGLWGQGIYFATNSSYAHRYTFKTNNGNQCMFVAYVFIGNSKELPQDKSITCPPSKPNITYHSVQGKRDGELIHIIYRNSMAYPAFLITYRARE